MTSAFCKWTVVCFLQCFFHHEIIYRNFILFQVSKSNFKILLEYIEELKGAAREQTLKIAKDFVEKNEDAEGIY